MADFGILSFFLFFLFSLSHLPFILGVARFIEPPPSNITVLRNANATMKWSYEVGSKNEFKDNSPLWEYKEVGGTWSKIAYEDGNDGWKFKIRTDCPPKFLNPLRVRKESVATLIILNTTLNDSGIYRCTLEMISGSPRIFSNEVQLTVTDTVPTTAPPTTVTTTPEPTGENITTTLTPTTPTPATSKNYKVMLNGTCNITKDVQQYIKNQTTEVFSVLSDFYNVTVAVKELSSIRFIINLNLWFNKTVNESTIETYVAILQERINNTCHFLSTIIAISTATPTLSPTTGIKVEDCTTGVKVGCAIGLIIAVVIIVVIAVVIYKKKKEKKDWATWEKALVVIGFIVAIVIIIVIIVVLVDKKCT